MSVCEIELKFPYLYEENPHGLMFSASVPGTLDAIINYNGNHIPVALYDSMEEIKYAIKSSYRYLLVDPLFRVGEVSKFNPATGIMIIKADEKYKDLIVNGRVVPRVGVTKIIEVGEERLKLHRLICIDILNTIKKGV